MTAPKPIDGKTSLVLDCLRLGAALTVLFRHAEDMWFPARIHQPSMPGDLSHAAVIVFFVLPGFVIAYTTSQNNRGLVSYLQARCSRLWSMVIPALVLTAIVEIVVRIAGNADLIALYIRSPSLPRYAFAATFLNELWFFSAAPPMNRPLWSLGFEFWYYLIFGLWFCTGRGLKSWALALGACVIAGPKILLMMPIWLMGCAAYRLPRPALPDALSWACAALALGAAALSVAYVPPYPSAIGVPPFYFANQFATDWVAGSMVALALWFLPTGTGSPPRVDALAGKFRVLADLTFPIYVLHWPMLVLCQVLFDYEQGNAVQFRMALLGTLGFTALLGIYLEQRRQAWTSLLQWAWKSASLRVAQAK